MATPLRRRGRARGTRAHALPVSAKVTSIGSIAALGYAMDRGKMIPMMMHYSFLSLTSGLPDAVNGTEVTDLKAYREAVRENFKLPEVVSRSWPAASWRRGTHAPACSLPAGPRPVDTRAVPSQARERRGVGSGGGVGEGIL